MRSFNSLTDVVFDEDATISDLLELVSALALFWAGVFYLLSIIVRPLVHGKTWLVAAGERDYERGGRELYEKLRLPTAREEFVDMFMSLWAWNQGVALQHFAGGALCVPAIFGLGDERTASSLACLGILSEMAFEIEDTISWLYKRYSLPDGKAKVTKEVLIVIVIHHSMTTLLGLPMVLHYRNLRTLHWLCFDLQIAAGIALAVQEYTKLLDITRPGQLRQFQVLSLFAVVVMVLTRGFHWIYLCAELISVWYREGAWTFLGVGSIISIIFTVFNWVFCIVPYWKRFAKFARVKAEYEKLPPDADAQRRRSSVVILQKAAADVVGHRQIEEDLLSLVVDRKVERRVTMPPSLFASKRKSMILLRSSVGDISNIMSHLDTDTQWNISKKRL